MSRALKAAMKPVSNGVVITVQENPKRFDPMLQGAVAQSRRSGSLRLRD